jgi:hypothetical protein
MKAKSQLMAKISVGFNRFGQAQCDLIGYFANGIARSPHEDVLQTQWFNERLPFEQQTNPFEQQ